GVFPVVIVENHPALSRDRDGQPVHPVPTGQPNPILALHELQSRLSRLGTFEGLTRQQRDRRNVLQQTVDEDPAGLRTSQRLDELLSACYDQLSLTRALLRRLEDKPFAIGSKLRLSRVFSVPLEGDGASTSGVVE